MKPDVSILYVSDLDGTLPGVKPGDLVFEVIVYFGTLLAVLTVPGGRFPCGKGPVFPRAISISVGLSNS